MFSIFSLIIKIQNKFMFKVILVVHIVDSFLKVKKNLSGINNPKSKKVKVFNNLIWEKKNNFSDHLQWAMRIAQINKKR